LFHGLLIKHCPGEHEAGYKAQMLLPPKQAEHVILGLNVQTIVFGVLEFDWNKSAVCNLRLKSILLYQSQFGMRKRRRFGQPCVLAR
jgi:hypothetical protein